MTRYGRGGDWREPEVLFGIAVDNSGWLVAPTAEELVNPIMGIPGGRPMGGSVWRLSEYADARRDLDATAWDKMCIRYGFTDILSLVVESNSDRVTLIEFFYTTHDKSDAHLGEHLLNFVGASVVDLWERRPTGYARAMKNRVATERKVIQHDTVALTSHNPMKLTRSEFRICNELLKGRTTKEIGAALGISHHTVRSHLTKIFHKTKTKNQRELVLSLVSMNNTVTERKAL